MIAASGCKHVLQAARHQGDAVAVEKSACALVTSSWSRFRPRDNAHRIYVLAVGGCAVKDMDPSRC